MTNHTIITIGRQFGSGGHEIGNRLSERLNIPLYDNNLISMAAHELSISQEAAEKVDETILGKFLSAYVVNMRDYTVFINDSNESVPLSDKVYEVQSSIINRLADRGPCIFVGRCADVVLKDHENCYSFFIHSPLEERIKRIVETEHVTERQAKKMIKQTDWERSSYHNYYTKQKWGDPGNYDLMINSARTGIQKAVEIIMDYVK